MASLQDHAGDGNVDRRHHTSVQLYLSGLLIQEIDDDEGHWFRLSNEYGEIDLTPEQKAGLKKFFNSRRPGPPSYVEDRERVSAHLELAFEIKDTWKQTTLDARLLELGFKRDVIDAVRLEMDIAAKKVHGGRGLKGYWVWTVDGHFNWREFRAAHPEFDEPAE